MSPGPSPGQPQFGSRPGQAHIEQALLLSDRCGGIGQDERQQPVRQSDHRDRLPLQTLGRMNRRQRHGIVGRVLMLGIAQHEGHLGRSQFAGKDLGLGVDPVQHRKLSPCQPTVMLGDQPGDGVGGFGLLVGGRDDLDRGTPIAGGPKPGAGTDQRIRHRQHLRG
ncbi:hypothetical protein SDC9_137501 [bioreactor metagenome]|uniref:Uncharacterized protein n=1 Tax=bioreactor metagenome TaxID=1076179 RepID=A0A645DLQ7_9ZZZZ